MKHTESSPNSLSISRIQKTYLVDEGDVREEVEMQKTQMNQNQKRKP